MIEDPLGLAGRQVEIVDGGPARVSRVSVVCVRADKSASSAEKQKAVDGILAAARARNRV